MTDTLETELRAFIRARLIGPVTGQTATLAAEVLAAPMAEFVRVAIRRAVRAAKLRAPDPTP